MFIKKLFLALLFLAGILHADYVITYKVGEDTMSFYYKNAKTSKMVMTSNDSKVEIYHINNNSYLVNYDDDINIVDLNEMKTKARQMGFDPSRYAQNQKIPKVKVKKTRKDVWVGGIKGHEWVITVKEDGQKYKNRVVVSNDKRVVRVVRAMFKALSNMNEGISGYDKYYELKKGYVTIKADGMKLKSFKRKNISSREYELPNINSNKRYKNRNSSLRRRQYEEESTTVNYLGDDNENDDNSDDEINDEPQYTSDDINNEDSSDDLDKATNLLKSFF
jgi:hypothetical protein